MFVLKLYFVTIISVAQHLYQKRKGSGAGSASGSVLMTNGSRCGSARPQNESGSGTLPQTVSAQKDFTTVSDPDFDSCFAISPKVIFYFSSLIYLYLSISEILTREVQLFWRPGSGLKI
jgi:hypothetical protein